MHVRTRTHTHTLTQQEVTLRRVKRNNHHFQFEDDFSINHHSWPRCKWDLLYFCAFCSIPFSPAFFFFCSSVNFAMSFDRRTHSATTPTVLYVFFLFLVIFHCLSWLRKTSRWIIKSKRRMTEKKHHVLTETHCIWLRSSFTHFGCHACMQFIVFNVQTLFVLWFNFFFSSSSSLLHDVWTLFAFHFIFN